MSGEKYMFGLNFNAANQLRILPVIESQAVYGPDAQQKSTVDT